MKRSWRWYLAWGTMVASLSLLLFMATAGPAHAWTQNVNTFTCDQNGNCSGNGYCGQDSSHPCLYWEEAAHTSISLYFYMDPSLQNAGGYNFITAIQNAFNQYNSAPAWNPYMYQWHSGNPTFGGTYTMGSLPCGVLGNTSESAGSLWWGYNAYWDDYEWGRWMTDTTTTFNSTVKWNSSLNWTVNSCSDYHADGITVATHESGHVQGLGHTGHSAIMYPIASATTTPFHTLQGDDVQGIIGIYPGIPPDDCIPCPGG